MNKKALVLLSGGLDSILATKMMLEQDIETEAVNFLTVFCTCTKKSSCQHEARRVADNFGVKLHVMNVTEEYLEIIKNPKHGYGKNMNPCIDCRIFMFKKAKELMGKIGASFIVTGEVLGERPMSQRKEAIGIIEKESGLQGLVLRPLSAKNFEPTVPEKEGIVNREAMLDITGRSRKPQIALAKSFGIEEYMCPAGGCLLTDQIFAKRIKDLIKHDEFNLENIKLLKVGRHFRNNGAKIIIGRDKEDNEKILNIAKEKDVIVKIKDVAGPVTLIRGDSSFNVIEFAAALTAGYTKEKGKTSLFAEYQTIPGGMLQTLNIRPMKISAEELNCAG
ncbi:MAG: hypothetical protein COS99_05565 [Candidatus Omnitrophica bacterium CG07_land_8_20_14_0_80_42_15]|uniref:Uncharacterized protein n=1 Tax=Candidatus Aquitaenariimonas noxiae TaxID=1974741 RepID=A0A2J0KYG0_9BACT|nr:MAG: hypothetical protein COS99_05565 [Candidatus Omnitrophica bacterium CG07_land_8_20_14_0_80_42_15]